MSVADINLLEVLKEAAKSPLGIIALVILAMSVVGVILFRKSEDKYKFGVFTILFIGIIGFTYASLQIIQPTTPNNISDIASVDQNINNDDLTITQNPKPTQEDSLSTKNESTQKEQGSVQSVSENNMEEGFIYLGTFSNGKWSDPRFLGATNALEKDEVITLSDSRKMFECAPYRKSLFSLSYTFCNEVIGNVEKGGKVRVLKPPVSVGLNRIWVYVKEVE